MKGNLLIAMFWMVLISLILFWLPVFGPIIAGFAGGRVAGSISRALLAAILPALIMGTVLFATASILTGMPLIGILAGAGGFILVISHAGFLLVGAILGGSLAG